jgi:anti-anti-sigma factor
MDHSDHLATAPAQASQEVVPVGDGQAIVITIAGEIDIQSDSLLSSQLTTALNRRDSLPVVVDLAGVTFFSTSGIAALAWGRSAAKRNGVRLGVVVRPGSTVETALRTIGIAQLLDVHPTRAKALQAIVEPRR